MFRFTIRDVLWLMVVVGVTMTGAMCSQRLSHTVRAANEKYESERAEKDKAEVELELVEGWIMDMTNEKERESSLRKWAEDRRFAKP